MSDTIPCHQLAEAALIARVASTMDTEGKSHPAYPLRPGFCRFCNHPLPYAFSATGVIDGVLKRAEWGAHDPIGEKVQLNMAGAMELGAGTALVYRASERVVKCEGLRPIGDMFPTVLLAPNGSCEALTSEVFRRASIIARARGAKVRADQQARLQGKELAAKRAAAAAARQIASQVQP